MRTFTRGSGSAGALILLAGLATGLVAPAPNQGGGFHEDARYGFKLRPPKGWTEIPLKVDEQWLAVKYLSDKRYYYIDPDTKWDHEHRPEMLVIAFVERPPEEEEEDPEIEVPDEGETKEIELKTNPYRDYEDYLDKTYSGGGFYVNAREELKVNSIPVTRIEIKVEKLARDGPKHIETWVYHLEGVDIAVQFEVLENAWKKLKSTVKRVHRSVKTIPRVGGGLGEQSLTVARITIGEMDEGDARQRRKTRIQAEMQYREKVLATLPDDWTTDQIGRCFVVSHVDAKYAKRVANQASAILGWLDETLPFVGPEEYVREPVLRICRDQDEESSFQRGGTNWFTTGIEIVTHKEAGTFDNFEWEWMNRQVYDLWFRDRDRDLYWALPSWLDSGLEDVLENSRLKGKKLEFRVDTWDRDELRNHVRDGNVTRPRELLRMTASEFSEGSSWNRHREASALVRFLLVGKGSKGRSKNLLKDYVLALDTIIAEIEAESEAASEDESDPVDARPTTEEEEDAMYRNRRSSWEKEERRIIDAAWERTVGSWSSRDWESFEKAYFDSIG